MLAFGVLDTGWRLSTTSCRNSKRPSPSIQVLLVSLAHVRVLAALPEKPQLPVVAAFVLGFPLSAFVFAVAATGFA